MERTLWGHLPLLVRANSKESVEFILQTLWRTRKSGLDADDRRLLCEMLQLQNESDLDPLLLCLRVLIRKCVYENISKDNIQKVFPEEVLPEIQRLLTLLLQKFQREWQADIHMDKVSLPRLKAMTWNTATQDTEMMEPLAVLNLKLQNDAQAPQEELDLKFQLAKETLDTMLKSMYCIRDQLSNLGET
ncbi:COMM domain-containing protein 9-like [Hibiscus syriacus]|uniref:COMM domain-containing protein 9-like n=1 Tax=Hibiscus syriacus TaxID=106335 RepID=UPI00192243C0|nr:COMM domain-containing protein 9-like [Hibiscus syriacus]